MAKLEVFLPVKPLVVTQAFGIYNPVYKQFGFTKHNGVDMAVSDGQPAYAPMDCIVIETGFNSGAGRYVKVNTLEPVQAEGKTGIVCLTFMHGKEIKVTKGQQLKAGDLLMYCDNTGFSTGHHLHVSAFFIDPGGYKMQIGDVDSDYCFDWSKYCNWFYAVDAQKVFAIYYKMIGVLKLWLAKQ